MAAAVSQLCVQTLRLVGSSSSNAVRLNRFHLFFIYISTSFSTSQGHVFHAVLLDFFTQYGLYGRPTCVMAEKEKSTSESSSLLSTLRERLLAKSAKQSDCEGISVPHQEVNPNVKQLLREKFCSPQSSQSHRNQRLIVMRP